MNHHPQAEPQNLGGIQRLSVFVLFFISGFAGLVYKVLWTKELGLLFGNTAQAAATTLAAFFLGIAGGGLVFGRISKRSRNPLRLYALLEFYDLILDLSPPESDPYLANIEPRLRSLPEAGFHLHSSRVYKASNDRTLYYGSVSSFNKLNILN